MPKEYIERDIFINNELIPLVKQLDLCHPKQKKGVLMAIQKLNETPTADVVEVVYCKECKHLYCCSAVDREFYCRHIHGMKGALNPIEEKPYCSYGERKESEVQGE